MLVKTINDIREYMPVAKSDKIENISPFVQQAERDFIIPYISKTQYDLINAAYNAAPPTLTTAQTDLLKKIQPALVLYAYYLWIPTGQLQISDSGIRIANTAEMKTAFQWQIADLRKSILAQAGSAMEELLVFMEEKKSDYPNWAASSAYTEYKDSFIANAKEFTQHFSLLGNSRINFLAVRSQMKAVEEMQIQAELGDDFYTELKNQHIANTLSANNKKVVSKLKHIIANYTINKALAMLAVTINENGILQLNNTGNSNAIDNRQPADNAAIKRLELQSLADGDGYLKKLKEFLKTNITDYPTYAASSAYNAETTDTYFKNDENQKGWAAML